MRAVPRIVVVDSSSEVAHIVRGAMTLLDRQYILIEVPTAEDVLVEVQEDGIDLVVTAYQVPGKMHGVELARRVVHACLDTPVIVLARDGDPVLSADDLASVPFQYYIRPVAEPFLRGLRIALDGAAAASLEEIPAVQEDALGPVPPIDIEALRGVVLSLMRDVGAMGIILADRTGRVLIDQGATGYIDREKLAAIMGPSFARASDIKPLIGGEVWTLHYYDGERLDVFGLALGIHYFMCLLFEGSNRGAFGPVTMFGRRAAEEMIALMGEAAYRVRTPEPLSRLVEEEPVSAEVEEAEQPVGSDAVLTKTPESVEAPGEEQPMEPSADIDLETLFDQGVDESLANSLFDPDDLGEIAASIDSDADSRVGYDDAMDMGILDG